METIIKDLDPETQKRIIEYLKEKELQEYEN
jgi:hypothetical protein